MKHWKWAVLLLVLLATVGCGKKEGNNTTKVIQTVYEVEVHSEYNAVEWLRDTSASGYTIEVIDDGIDIDHLGVYPITYQITSADGKQKETMECEITVVDTTAPVLSVPKTITMPQQNDGFDILNYATATDNLDGNISEAIEWTGSIEPWTPGSYRIEVTVTDSSGNQAYQAVTLNIEASDEEDDSTADGSLYGTYYVDYSDSTSDNPTLILNADGTFTLSVNYCAGFQVFSGRYQQDGNRLTLTSDGFDFSDEPGSASVELQRNSDGTLQYLSDYVACSPVQNDRFIKK